MKTENQSTKGLLTAHALVNDINVVMALKVIGKSMLWVAF